MQASPDTGLQLRTLHPEGAMRRIIAAPFLIVVDEAGTLMMEARRSGEPPVRPFVVCAAGIPARSEEAVWAALPRSSETGQILTCKDHAMTDSRAASALRVALRHGCVFSLVMIDASGPSSISLAEDASNLAVVPGTSPAEITYQLAIAEAIRGAWGLLSKKYDRLVPSIDVVLHNPQLDCGNLDATFVQVSGKHGISIPRFSWTKNEGEELLHLADIGAGVPRRQASHGDLPVAWSVLWENRHSAVHIEDGLTINGVPRTVSAKSQASAPPTA